MGAEILNACMKMTELGQRWRGGVCWSGFVMGAEILNACMKMTELGQRHVGV